MAVWRLRRGVQQAPGLQFVRLQQAAAGFVESARHLGILILTHRRLLVSQFNRELTSALATLSLAQETSLRFWFPAVASAMPTSPVSTAWQCAMCTPAPT